MSVLSCMFWAKLLWSLLASTAVLLCHCGVFWQFLDSWLALIGVTKPALLFLQATPDLS